MNDADRAAFKEESRRLFRELGWAVRLGSNGGCDTVTKDWQDRYEEYQDLSDEAYRAEQEAKLDEITGYILEKCRTKRSNLYIVAPVAVHVAEHFEIRRLCDRDRHNKIGNQFVAELMDELLQKGWLVTAKTSHGDGIRTATDKERGISRQPAAQVDGQIAMQSQENDAQKKKKGRKLSASRLFTLVLMLALSLNRWIYTRKEPFIKRQYLRAVTKKSTPCDKIEHPEKNTI